MIGQGLRRAQQRAKPSLRTLADLGMLSAAYWLAFLLRFDGDPPLQMWKLLLFTWPYVILLEFGVLHLAAVTRYAWSYVGLREAAKTLVAVLGAAVLLLLLRLSLVWVLPFWGYAAYAMVPIGIIGANAALAFLGVIGTRALRRLQHERGGAQSLPETERIPTLLVGAGGAGMLVAREIANHSGLPLRAVGFIDDDPSKHGLTVHGIRVLGSRAELVRIARDTDARQVVITMTGAGGDVVREIYEACAGIGLDVKVMPGIYQILDGQVNLSRIRPVSIEDLLGREAVELDEVALSRFLRGKRILVTGAGGSIGSELCRQVARFEPGQLVLVERAEAVLFEIHRQLAKSLPGLSVVPCVADVCDEPRIRSVFDAYSPEVVFHAAAHKHVPMMEWNPGEAIKNNIGGTRVVADAADRIRAEAFVLVSTDKAVNPTSVMGATKRVAEMYVQALSERSATRFVAVRFGNVLGSTGSVVPIFEAQIAEGGPVTVTHPHMVRYFMTIPEASQLVIQAAAMGGTGQIFVLDMGRPVRIMDLANQLIRLSGLEPGVDIAIELSGVRPGEKLVEELAFDAEKMERTSHAKIFIGKLGAPAMPEVERRIAALNAAAKSGIGEQVLGALRLAVPEMRESLAPPVVGSDEREADLGATVHATGLPERVVV